MSNPTISRSPRAALAFALCAGLALGLSANAHAEPGGGASQPADPPLRGPHADDNRAPGAQGEFGGGERRLRDRPDMRAFHEAMMDTLGPDGPADLRASEDQHKKIESIMSGFRDQMRAYMDQHRDEVAALRSQAGDGMGGPRRRGPRGDGAPPPPTSDAKPAAPSPETQAAREKLRQIMENAPKPDGAINQVWQVLSPAQKQAVETRWAEIKSEHAKERRGRIAGSSGGAGGTAPNGQQLQQRRPGRGRPGPDSPPPNPGDNPPGDGSQSRADGPGGPPPPPFPPPPDRMERLRAMIDRLSPEERRDLMNQLADRRPMGPPPRRGPGGPDEGFQRMPPPPPPPPMPEFDPPDQEL